MTALVMESGLRLLLAVRLRVLRNQFAQALRQQPLRILGTAGSVLLIWAGLYIFLVWTFRLVRRPVLEGIVATPLIFTFFFLTLTGMLTFSCAILSYGSLFRRRETAYLLAGPMNPRDIVLMRHLETLVLSSWSLVLLGLPLMLAMARIFDESWSFYPLFLGLFLLFIPLPGALGLLLAYGVAVLFPRTPRRALIILAVPVVLLGGWWMWELSQASEASNAWLKTFYDRVAIIQNAMLPHTWVSKGINHAVQGQQRAAAFYLFVTAAHALLATILAVGLVSRGFLAAYDRGQTAGRREAHRSGLIVTWIAEVLFAYLPWRQRLLCAKDLKSFCRDPMQWSQMGILLGLLALYVSNAQRLWTDLTDPRLPLLVSFLNLSAVSLILATFTNRFLFPLISLDGQQLWLLGLLPLPRSRLVLAKFLYALTITLLAGLSVMAVSTLRLELARPLAASHLAGVAAICIGLCGVSVGMGARLPMFNERNPARIAGGFGGTVSLLLSVLLVVASLAGMGLMTLWASGHGYGDMMTPLMLALLGGVVALNIGAAVLAMGAGIRHFNRIEW